MTLQSNTRFIETVFGNVVKVFYKTKKKHLSIKYNSI